MTDYPIDDPQPTDLAPQTHADDQGTEENPLILVVPDALYWQIMADYPDGLVQIAARAGVYETSWTKVLCAQSGPV